jgi:hypothetical protein
MYYRTITLDPDKPDFPLEPVSLRQHSAAAFLIVGLPEGYKSAKLHITKPAASVPITVDISENESGEPYAYFNGSNFPAAGTGGKYEVTFVDADDRAFSAGEGTLQIQASTSPGASSGGVGSPANLYARNPVTGKYHALIVQTNELGEIAVSAAQTGEDLI